MSVLLLCRFCCFIVVFVDRFTQNLSMFRRDINDSLKGPNVNTSSASDMMTS